MNNPLFVPIEIEALAVNKNVEGNVGVNIQRWVYNYFNLNNYVSPQPQPFTLNNVAYPGTGIMLHWALPDVLRNGQQPDDSPAVQFPLVPNRWLVVRYSGPASARTATAWVVQSDAINNSNAQGGAAFLNPDSPSVQPVWLGQQVALPGWTEQYPVTGGAPLFLTAVAPGNPMFSNYQPYCPNVFSMFDPLTDVSAQDTVSYMLAGWYSDPDKDILESWVAGAGNDVQAAFNAFMQNARWMVAQEMQGTASCGMYHGMVLGINWDINGAAPNNIPAAACSQVAIGNTTTDALTALLQSQINAQGKQINADLLEALQYGLLPAFDEQDGDYRLQQEIEQSWFSSAGGGYGWEIIDQPVADNDQDPYPPISEEEFNYEQTWLAALNVSQQNYDNAVHELAAMQWNLYQTWWKGSLAGITYMPSQYPYGTTQQQFTDAMDPSNPDSLVVQVKNQIELVASLAKQIPIGLTQDELQSSIAAFAAGKNLPASRLLKQFALQPFQRSYDPVVLIQGMKADQHLVPVLPLRCRFQEQLVTAFNFNNGVSTIPITVAAVQGVIPMPPQNQLALLPPFVQNLIDEFFMLDPANATMIAQAALGSWDQATIDALAAAMQGGANVISPGVVPDVTLTPWTAPWSPLILEWEIFWYPINHDNGGAPLWSFDGNDYTWNGTGYNSGDMFTLRGMIFMTPQASFNFRAQLEKFIAENPGVPGLQELEDFIENTDQWDFLSQSLSGLTPMMLLRNTLPNISATSDPAVLFSPDVTLADLVATSATYVPVPGVAQGSFGNFPPNGFQNWRAGQFSFNKLMVVDRFGQTSDIINSTTAPQCSPVISEPLIPEHTVLPLNPGGFIQLPPRILQNARLNFDFVSCSNDNEILGTSPDINPVCAWLMHNYLDRSIATYDNTGQAIGAVWVATNQQDIKVVAWQPAPGSNFPTIASLLDDPDLKILGQMLQAIQDNTDAADAFNALLDTIDASSWIIDTGNPSADEGLAMLVGRPVALVRNKLKFQLQGPVITDPSWRFTFAPATNPMTGWDFTIRLGEAGMRQDGLIGYYIGTDYDTLYATNVPENNPDPDYVQAIATGSSLNLTFSSSSEVNITMIMDPRAMVHATTGILPVSSVVIPQPFVDAAFANMQVTFTVGPVLADLILPNDPSGDTPVSISIPVPSVKNGTWNWVRYPNNGDWDIAPVSPTVRFSNVPASLQTGLLKLTGAIGASTPGNV